MKKECQYCHHLKHHHHQCDHHSVGRSILYANWTYRSISLLWTNRQLRFFCQLVFLFLLTWSYVLFSPIFYYYLIWFFSLVALCRTRLNFGWFRTRIEGEKRNHPSFADCSTPVMCRHISWTLYYVDAQSYPDYRVIWSIPIPPFRIKLLSREFPTGKLCTA